VEFNGLLVCYTHLMWYRGAIHEVRVGIDSAVPDKVLKIAVRSRGASVAAIRPALLSWQRRNLARSGTVRHQAMRCNARVAVVLGAGPPRGHEAAPHRAVRRHTGGPICATAATLGLFGSAATKLAC
jgi:hypothetical protein